MWRPTPCVVRKPAPSYTGHRRPPFEPPNAVTATLEQAVYRGFMGHYYLTSLGGEPLIAFQQNQSQQAGLRYAVGEEVVARWDSASNHVIPHR